MLELPVKPDYPAGLCAAVTSTLCAWFGLLGGAVQVLALLTVATLALRERGAPTARLLAAAAAALLASLLLWAAVVAPVNATWAPVADPADVVATHARLRARWECVPCRRVHCLAESGWLGLVLAVTQSVQSSPHPASE